MAAGLHAKGVAPSTVASVFSAALRPILLYGAHCVDIGDAALADLQRTQGQLVKQALGLMRRSRHTRLLQVLRLPDCSALISRARLRMAKAALGS